MESVATQPHHRPPPRWAVPCTKRRFYKKDTRILRLARHYRRNEKRFHWCEVCGCYHLTSQEKE